MVYCVVPRALADELYPSLVEHYAGDENVTVIVDRREFDRRRRNRTAGAASPEEAAAKAASTRRVVRDRRRARVPGDLLPLAQVG
ncbi:MAG TPA: hypothetical protein VKG62_08290 [Solirubrobacteraceae bacterium]|nr:hypothetical protein [Solirubrobacteraceae bacterium]